MSYQLLTIFILCGNYHASLWKISKTASSHNVCLWRAGTTVFFWFQSRVLSWLSYGIISCLLVNSTQCRIVWEVNHKEKLCRPDWLVGTSVRGCLDCLNCCEINLKVCGTVPGFGTWPVHVEDDWASSMDAFISPALSYDVTGCFEVLLTPLQWQTI